MAPALPASAPTGEHFRHLARTLSSTFKGLSIRDVTSSGAPLASIFALVITSSSPVTRRALTSLTDISSSGTNVLTARSLGDDNFPAAHILKRQNAILAIPTTYAGLNSGPSPRVVVGIMLGTIGGALLVLYVTLLSFTFFTFTGNTTIKEEVVIKKKTRSKSRRSSHHSAAVASERIVEHISIHQPSPPPPPRSRRETIVEVEEEIIRHSRQPSRHPSPPSLEEVIVEEEETASEEIVEVIEEQSSIVSESIVSPSPPPQKPASSSRRSGFRIVDPAEFGGGDASMRRMSRRSSRNG